MTIIDISRGIQVGGFTYAVDMSEQAHRALIADNDAGQCDCRNQVISLDSGENEVVISKVFIHEIIEAINHIYCNDKVDHEKIQQLSFGLHQVCESLGIRFKGRG